MAISETSQLTQRKANGEKSILSEATPYKHGKLSPGQFCHPEKKTKRHVHM